MDTVNVIVVIVFLIVAWVSMNILQYIERR